jgi:hypothetical protein
MPSWNNWGNFTFAVASLAVKAISTIESNKRLRFIVNDKLVLQKYTKTSLKPIFLAFSLLNETKTNHYVTREKTKIVGKTLPLHQITNKK